MYEVKYIGEGFQPRNLLEFNSEKEASEWIREQAIPEDWVMDERD